MRKRKTNTTERTRHNNPPSVDPTHAHVGAARPDLAATTFAAVGGMAAGWNSLGCMASSSLFDDVAGTAVGFDLDVTEANMSVS